ncbi:MAG: hypothetical protein QXT86_05725 [Archaeoglobaceae archaeon]
MISALIFSMNRVENVVKLSEKIKDYVDEIVIIDSSDKEKFEEMKNRIPYAKIYWLPPLGMVELYYKIGLELCKNDWILHLEDDEEPSDELLKDLKKIISKNDSKVYAICRKETKSKQAHEIFRLFHKNYVVPSGLIHFVWASKVKPFVLDRRYYILHTEMETNFKKLKKFSIFESWQLCCKILYLIYGAQITHFKNQNTFNFMKKIGKILFYQSKLGKFGWFLLATEFNLCYLLLFLMKSSRTLKFIVYSLIYSLFIQINLLKDFSKKLEASLKMWEMGVFEFLGLDSYENALKSLKGIDSGNGLENFFRLIEIRLKNLKSENNRTLKHTI